MALVCDHHVKYSRLALGESLSVSLHFEFEELEGLAVAASLVTAYAEQKSKW